MGIPSHIAATSQRDAMLLTMFDLSGEGWDDGALHAGFPDTTLTVEAWKRHPSLFAMRGYPQHPDHKRAYVLFCGVKSLVAAGLVERCGPNWLRLTAAGVLAAKELRMSHVRATAVPVPDAR